VAAKSRVPGSIYLNGRRYWWSVRLPGETTRRAIPLRPPGARYATTDRRVAEQVARDLYARAVFRAEAATAPPDAGTVAGLAKAYMEHVEQHYIGPEGRPSQEPMHIRLALAPLLDLYAALDPADFGPLALQTVRQAMIDADLSRRTVNQRTGMIKRMFKWATAQELIPASTYHGLLAVDGLKRGRAGVREGRTVTPIDETWVRRTQAALPATVAAMVEVQLWTGMRSTEVCTMRPCDIDRRGKVWTYTPAAHKTTHHGHRRVVPLGPKAQAALRPFLDAARKTNAYLFSPAESEADRRAKQHAARKTPLGQGNRPGTNRRADPRRTPGERYDRTAYRRAIERAIGKANRRTRADLKRRRVTDPDAIQAALIPHWTPHQLRHTAATRIRREMGLDAARALLGHRSLAIADTYAELDQALAAKAASQFG